MKTLKTIFSVLGVPFAKLPFCSLPGAVVGSFTGFVFSVFELENPALPLLPHQLMVIGVLLGSTGWLLVLFLFGVLLRYGVAWMLWYALVNALVTAVLTVWVAYSLHRPAIAGLTGLLLGILVGLVLCRLCPSRERSVHGQA